MVSITNRSSSDRVLGPYADEGYEEALDFSGHVEGKYVQGLAVRDGQRVDVKLLSIDNHLIGDVDELSHRVDDEISKAFDNELDGKLDINFDVEG